ncbi:MAG: hypothetical protein HY690_13470 [Chloroflexi bacterium]|nr:hypothetical protein [Chloroflexota bacterium]
MQNVYAVQCMLCGRTSGQVRNGAFHRAPTAPPLKSRGGRHWCGFCGGNIYLEHDDSGAMFIDPAPAARPLYPQRRAS